MDAGMDRIIKANGWGWDVGWCLSTRARESPSRRSRAVGPFSPGAPELASIFGGGRCALGRAGVDQCPRPRGGGDRPHRSRDPRGAAPRARRMRSAFPSAPPEPRGSRELNDSTPGRPTRHGLEITVTGPGPSTERCGAASRPVSLPSPSSLGTSTHRPGSSPPPFPRDKPAGPLPGVADHTRKR